MVTSHLIITLSYSSLLDGCSSNLCLMLSTNACLTESVCSGSPDVF